MQSKPQSIYKRKRSWADQYTPALNQIAANLLFRSSQPLLSVYFDQPSLVQDQQFGIDQTIRAEPIPISYRVRNYDHKRYFMNGFTLRTNGGRHKSELQKVQEGSYSQYMLYALADKDKPGEIDSAVLIDIWAVGAAFKQYPDLLHNGQAKWSQGFVDFPYHDYFPWSVIAGMWNLKEKAK